MRARIAAIAGTLLCGVVAMHGALAAGNGTPHHESATAIVVVPPVQTDRYRGLRSQLPNSAIPIAVAYPKAKPIGLAIVVVPDPRVPRYRRSYDLSIAAVELGMLKDGYVLDRYSFPWSDVLRRGSEPAAADESASESDHQPAGQTPAVDSIAYGVMIFRCDAWRNDRCSYQSAGRPDPQGNAAAAGAGKEPEAGKESGKEARIRALYIVTETATAGVAKTQLQCAIRKIESQVEPNSLLDPTCPGEGIKWPPYSQDAKRLLYPKVCSAAKDTTPPLVALGPNFSGTMDSIGEAVADMATKDPQPAQVVMPAADTKAAPQTRRLCLVSGAATDSTNHLVEDNYGVVRYRTLALEDTGKMLHIAKLAVQLGAMASDAPVNGIAILAARGIRRRRGVEQFTV